MTEVFIGCCTITTWGWDGQQVWRIRSGDRTADFLAPRDTTAVALHTAGHFNLDTCGK